MDTLFTGMLLAHTLGAICGLAAIFASPFIMKGGNTVSTAKVACAVNKHVENLAKFVSLALLVTGLIICTVHTYLFTVYHLYYSLFSGITRGSLFVTEIR